MRVVVVLFIVLFLLAAVVGLVVSFLMMYAAAYVVVEEYSPLIAIEAAWRLFLDHWLVSLEAGLILLLMNAVLAVFVLSTLCLIFLPTMFLWLIATSLMSSILYYVAIVIGCVFFILFIAFFGSVFNSFTTVVWTDLFMKMHRHGLVSHLARLFGKR